MELTDRTKIAIGVLFFAGLAVTVVVMDRLTTFPPPPVPVFPSDAGAGPATPAATPATAPRDAPFPLPAPAPGASKQEALQRVNDAARDAELKKLRGPNSTSGHGAVGSNDSGQEESISITPMTYEQSLRHLEEMEVAAIKSNIVPAEVGAAETAGINRARAEMEAELMAAEAEVIAQAARRKQEEELHNAELLKHRRDLEQRLHLSDDSPSHPEAPAKPGLPAGVVPQKAAPELPPGMTREKKP